MRGEHGLCYDHVSWTVKSGERGHGRTKERGNPSFFFEKKKEAKKNLLWDGYGNNAIHRGET
jgi:hypothetical protein